MKIPPGTPEPLTTSWGPHLDAGRWVEPTPEVLFATSQIIEQLESASESEESTEVGDSPEEDDASLDGSTANEDEPDHVPATADSEREATPDLEREATPDSVHEATDVGEREVLRQALIMEMHRLDRAQIERRDEADMRELLARILSRRPLW